MARRLSIGRLRGGELLAGVGAVALFVALFLPWFGFEPLQTRTVEFGGGGMLNSLATYNGLPDSSGWDRLGWFVLALAVAAVAGGAWLVLATSLNRPVTQVIGAAVIASTATPLAFLALLLRALAFQPGPDDLTTVRYGAWIGLAGAALLTVGAWWSLADERTDAPESAYVPPAPRPAPPPASS
jgi:hypothetical protein